MSNSPDAILPRRIRDTFEQFGVIKPVAWPKLDLLAKAISARKYRYEVATGQDGTASARITAMGQTFTAIDGEPERALAKAFHQCLKETGSAQLHFLSAEPDQEEAGDDDEEPDAVATVDRTPLPPDAPRAGMRLSGQGLGEELVWDEQARCFYGADTGERVEGTVADIIRGGIDRVLAEKSR